MARSDIITSFSANSSVVSGWAYVEIKWLQKVRYFSRSSFILQRQASAKIQPLIFREQLHKMTYALRICQLSPTRPS